jgi:hypothetical protein
MIQRHLDHRGTCWKFFFFDKAVHYYTKYLNRRGVYFFLYSFVNIRKKTKPYFFLIWNFFFFDKTTHYYTNYFDCRRIYFLTFEILSSFLTKLYIFTQYILIINEHIFFITGISQLVQ